MKICIKSGKGSNFNKYSWELSKDNGEIIAKSEKFFVDKVAAVKEILAVQNAFGKLRVLGV